MSTQFCDRYRERNVSQPRELLVLRNAPVDLTKWQRISSGRDPRGLLRQLADRALVSLDRIADLARPRRRAR